MSHHIYTTPGFIVHSSPHGEAGRFFLVFTRDLGMVGATAQGVRLSQSKLRYHTQDFSYGLFSLVRGREVWRVTGAQTLELRGQCGIADIESRKLYVRILSLLKRLLPGEDKNEGLFGVIEEFFKYLGERQIDKEGLELVEYLTVFRILFFLGYIHPKEALEAFCKSPEIDIGILERLRSKKDRVISDINNGLKESQL